MIHWNALTSVEQLDQILQESMQHPVLIYKHSNTCSISHMAQSRLERQWQAEVVPTLKPYFLDLLRHRDVSKAVAERLGVRHESPQVLLVQDGKCVYDESHMGIRFDALPESVRLSH